MYCSGVLDVGDLVTNRLNNKQETGRQGQGAVLDWTENIHLNRTVSPLRNFTRKPLRVFLEILYCQHLSNSKWQLSPIVFLQPGQFPSLHLFGIPAVLQPQGGCFKVETDLPSQIGFGTHFLGLMKTTTYLASRLVRNQGIFAAGSFFRLFVANF